MVATIQWAEDHPDDWWYHSDVMYHDSLLWIFKDQRFLKLGEGE